MQTSKCYVSTRTLQCGAISSLLSPEFRLHSTERTRLILRTYTRVHYSTTEILGGRHACRYRYVATYGPDEAQQTYLCEMCW